VKDVDTKSKLKLAALMNAVQPVIDEYIKTMSNAEVNYILTNYRNYLKINLEQDLEKAREVGLKESPFDDILNGD